MKLFSNIHESLSQRSKPYKAWHTKRYSSYIHLSILIFFFIAISMIGAYLLVPQNPRNSEASTLGPDFPRLGLRWPSPSTQSISDIARYEFVSLFSYPWKTDAQYIPQIKAANPSIKVLASPNAQEVNYYRGSNSYNSKYNVELRTASMDWMLTQVGSTLTSSLSQTATTFTLADASNIKTNDIILIGGWSGSGVSDPNSEVAFVSSVSGNNVTVTRGEITPALTHVSGARVAAVIRIWVDSSQPTTLGGIVMDLSASCPSVGGKTFRDWNIERSVAYMNSGDFDGVDVDSAGIWTGFVQLSEYNRNVDWQRNNTVDWSSSVTNQSFVDSYNNGMKQFISGLKATVGAGKIVLPNGNGIPNHDANGTIFESYPSKTWDLNTWRSVIIGPWGSVRESYLQHTVNDADPNFTIMLTYGTATDYAHMRYALTSTLLGDGYFSFPQAAYKGIVWYDEYSVNSSGIATGDASSKGYLGQPTSVAYDANTKAAYTSSTTVYRRDYDNGISIVNPDTVAHTVTLGGTYKKIKGTQDPAINDGSTVTSITLQPKDGIILLREQSAPINTNDIYVSKSGNDTTGDGSQTKPYLTISKAVSYLGSGKTIYVSAGTYNEKVTFPTTVSGTAGSMAKLVASEGVIVSQGIIVQSSYTEVSGFEIVGGASTTDTRIGQLQLYGDNNLIHDFKIKNVNYNAGISLTTGASSNTIQDFVIDGAKTYGMTTKNPSSYTGADHTLIKNGTITNYEGYCGIEIVGDYNTVDNVTFLAPTGGSTVTQDGDGIRVNSAANTVIKNSTIHRIFSLYNPTNQHTDALQTWQGVTNLVVENNVIGTWEQNPVYPSMTGPQNGILSESLVVGQTSTLFFKNNVFLGNFEGGWSVLPQNSSVGGLELTFYNNTFWSAPPCLRGGSLVKFKFRNNIFKTRPSTPTGGTPPGTVDSDYNLYLSGSATVGEGSHSIIADPKFINLDLTATTDWGLTADFQLQSTSPAINAGVLDGSTPLTDKNGNTRVGVPDIGAYEQQGGTSCSKSADISGDDKVNITDAAMLMAKWNDVVLSSDPVDLDCSKKIDITDAAILMAHWGT